MTESGMNESSDRPVSGESTDRADQEQLQTAAPPPKRSGAVKLLVTLCVVVTLASVGLAAALLADRSDLELRAEALENARLKSILARDRMADEVETLKQRLSDSEDGSRDDAVPDEVASLKKLPSEVQALLAGGAEKKVVTTSRVRLRAAPSLEGKELAVLGADVPIEVLGVAQNGQWIKTAFIGYVFHDLVKAADQGATDLGSTGGVSPDPKVPQRTLKTPENPDAGAVPSEPLSDGQPSSSGE